MRRFFRHGKALFPLRAMNSGKSTALMQVAHNYEEQGMRVFILKRRWTPRAAATS